MVCRAANGLKVLRQSPWDKMIYTYNVILSRSVYSLISPFIMELSGLFCVVESVSVEKEECRSQSGGVAKFSDA